MQIDLSGRSAVITGGSKGVGLAVATRFAASGADVAIVARGRAALDQAKASIAATAHGKVVALQGDVAVAASVNSVKDRDRQAEERKARAWKANRACKNARVGGKGKCLQRGQFCSKAYRSQYPKYGFRCVNGRLR